MVWDTQQSEVLILPRTLNVSPTLYVGFTLITNTKKKYTFEQITRTSGDGAGHNIARRHKRQFFLAKLTFLTYTVWAHLYSAIRRVSS